MGGHLRKKGDGRFQGSAILLDGADLTSCYPRTRPGMEWAEGDEGFLLLTPTPESIAPVTINKTGMFVLELADGRRSLSEIGDIIGDAFDLADPPHAMVAAFIDEALYDGLVTLHRSAGAG